MPRIVAALALFAALAVTLHAQIPGIFSVESLDGTLTWNGVAYDAPGTGDAASFAVLRHDGWGGVGLADLAAGHQSRAITTGATWATLMSASVTVESGDDVLVSVTGLYQWEGLAETDALAIASQRDVWRFDAADANETTQLDDLPAGFWTYEPPGVPDYRFPSSTYTPAANAGGLASIGGTFYAIGYSEDQDASHEPYNLWSFTADAPGSATNLGAIGVLSGGEKYPFGMAAHNNRLEILYRDATGTMARGLRWKLLSIADPTAPGTVQDRGSIGSSPGASTMGCMGGLEAGIGTVAGMLYVLCSDWFSPPNQNQRLVPILYRLPQIIGDTPSPSPVLGYVASPSPADAGRLIEALDGSRPLAQIRQGRVYTLDIAGVGNDLIIDTVDLGLPVPVGGVNDRTRRVSGMSRFSLPSDGCRLRLRRGTVDVDTVEFGDHTVLQNTPFVDSPPTGTHSYQWQMSAANTSTLCHALHAGVSADAAVNPIPSMLVQAFYGS